MQLLMGGGSTQGLGLKVLDRPIWHTLSHMFSELSTLRLEPETQIRVSILMQKIMGNPPDP